MRARLALAALAAVLPIGMALAQPPSGGPDATINPPTPVNPPNTDIPPPPPAPPAVLPTSPNAPTPGVQPDVNANVFQPDSAKPARGAPPQSADTPPTETSTYPPCTKTLQDNCVTSGARKGHK